MKTKNKLVSATVFVGIAMVVNTNAQTTVTTPGGTAGYIPKFNSTFVVTNSQIQDNGTNVGIGGAGSYKLDVNGDINAASGSAYKVGGYTVVRAGSSSSTDYFGAYAGQFITSGLNNSYHGYSAGWKNTTGYYNTCVGQYANAENTSGSENTVTGFQAGYYSGSGSYNTICGKEAGYGVYNATPNNYGNNSFFGYKAGYGTTSGGNNVFMGYEAGYSNSTGAQNIFIGSNAGIANTTGGNNVFIGYYAGNANSTGAPNVGIGTGALQFNTTGNQNTATGFQALLDNTTGNSNTATGLYALTNNTTGSDNSGFGAMALNANTSGTTNTAVGKYSLYTNTTSSAGTAVGYSSLFQTTGASNTGIGQISGYTNTTGTNNTYVGYGADANGVAYTNATAVGNGAIITGSNKVFLGNASITSVNIVAGATYSGSDGRFKTNVTENVKGLEFINKLRPVTYNFNTNAFDDFLIQHLSDSLKAVHKLGMDFTGSSAIVHAGFIAQEVEQAAQQSGFTSSIIHHPDNDKDFYSVSYAEIVVPLVKAVQELSKTVDSLKTALNICCTAQQERSMQVTPSDPSQTSPSNPSQLSPFVPSQTSIHSKDVELNNKNIVVLDQNAPNPFADQTVINYYLPDNFNRAQMLFLDQSGKLIKVVDLTEKGQGKVNVFANDLTNGIYTYSLVVDGKTMETKKMVKQ